MRYVHSAADADTDERARAVMTPEPSSKSLVIDASAAIQRIRREPSSRQTLALVETARREGRRLLVPSIFWLELINVLGRRYRQTPGVILEAIAELEAVGLETVDLDRPMLLLAIDAVARHGLTAYEAAYLALADAADAQLLTADARLAAAAGNRALLITGDQPPHAIAETPDQYAGTWADWPGAAAYLRQLRARSVTDASSVG